MFEKSTSDGPPTLLVVLTDEKDPHRVAAELPAFLRFSDEATFGLEDLVDRWESKASPISRYGSLRRLPPTTAV